jgi:hypothetical protein
MRDENRFQLERRILSDNDADLAADVTIGTVKFAINALAILKASDNPGFALSLAAAAELGGIELESRKQRIAKFWANLWKSVRALPQERQRVFETQFTTEEGARILEVAYLQAASSVDPEKLEAIASLLKNSLSSEDLREHQTRWLLRLLDQVDVVQILMLKSLTPKNQEDLTFPEKHAEVFQDDQVLQIAYPGHFEENPHATEEEKQKIWQQWQAERQLDQERYQISRERHSIYLSRLHHLVELGLLGATQKFGGIIETGVTALGMALLKITDAADYGEWGEAEQTNAVQAMADARLNLDKGLEDAFRF